MGEGIATENKNHRAAFWGAPVGRREARPAIPDDGSPEP